MPTSRDSACIQSTSMHAFFALHCPLTRIRSKPELGGLNANTQGFVEVARPHFRRLATGCLSSHEYRRDDPCRVRDRGGGRPRSAAAVHLRRTGAALPSSGRRQGDPDLRHRCRWPGPGATVGFNDSVLGYPIESLADLPAGEYHVQAVLHRYETFHRSDGHTVKLPMDRGEGQQWNRAPGNLYSEPKLISLDSGRRCPDHRCPRPDHSPHRAARRHRLRQTRADPERASHRVLGTTMFLGAHVLLPHGYDEHPEARYPLMVFHGHFPADLGDFRTEPPDPDLECEFSERFRVECYNRIQQQEAYDSYQRWISPDFPRFLVVEIQHANPYYDDSYAVNSANLGPYGDAITHELIPYIEERFRGLGEGWARFLYGGSTGGWEALAAQVFYPDDYNGAFAACPDPIDFRAYVSINIYDDDNAYYYRRPVPSHRETELPRLARRHLLHHPRRLADGVRPRRQRSVRPTVRHLGGGLLTGRRRRLSETPVGPADRRHRPRGRRVLARQLRSPLHPRARLGRPSAPSSRARSTSSPATWTTTTSTTPSI